jgi:hypothetical protein
LEELVRYKIEFVSILSCHLYYIRQPTEGGYDHIILTNAAFLSILVDSNESPVFLVGTKEGINVVTKSGSGGAEWRFTVDNGNSKRHDVKEEGCRRDSDENQGRGYVEGEEIEEESDDEQEDGEEDQDRDEVDNVREVPKIGA